MTRMSPMMPFAAEATVYRRPVDEVVVGVSQTRTSSSLASIGDRACAPRHRPCSCAQPSVAALRGDDDIAADRCVT